VQQHTKAFGGYVNTTQPYVPDGKLMPFQQWDPPSQQGAILGEPNQPCPYYTLVEAGSPDCAKAKQAVDNLKD
jgi:hypothetical protein